MKTLHLNRVAPIQRMRTARCHRLRDECDARFTLHILGDCKLHTAFAASRNDETEFKGPIRIQLNSVGEIM